MHVGQRLTLGEGGTTHGRKAKVSKPDFGNPTVRDYRGASGNVVTGEMRSHLATERAGVTLHLLADSPELYPNQIDDQALGLTPPACHQVGFVITSMCQPGRNSV